MFCPKCGQETYLIENILNITIIICENCKHEHSIKDNGQASGEKITEARRSFQRKFENEADRFQSKETNLNKIISKNIDTDKSNVKLHNPEDRVNEDIGKIKTKDNRYAGRKRV